VIHTLAINRGRIFMSRLVGSARVSENVDAERILGRVLFHCHSSAESTNVCVSQFNHRSFNEKLGVTQKWSSGSATDIAQAPNRNSQSTS
jgi:hypothetical protein